MTTRALGPGRLWKRGNAWVLVYADADGNRRQRTLGTDKRVAERRRMALIAERDMQIDGLGSREGQLRRLNEIASDYLEDLAPRVGDLHLKNVRQKLDRVLRELGDRRVRDLKPMDLIRLRNGLVADGRANRTANLHVDVTRAMLKWAVEVGAIASNPLQHVKRLPERAEHQRYRRRAMTDDEMVRFLAASEADDRENEHRFGTQRIPQTPYWAALLETGARYGELRQLTWGDVDFTKRLITFRAESTKSRRVRVIPFREGLADRLRSLRPQHERILGRLPTVQDRVFLSPEGRPLMRPTTNAMRVLDRLLERAGIPKTDLQGMKLDIHAVRHTFATRCARAGVAITHTQHLLGHSDPKLTAQVYTHVHAEDLRPAIDALPELERAPAARVKEAR